MKLRLLMMLVPIASHAQLVDDYNPPRGACCLPSTAQQLADRLQDWNQLGRYYADNQALKKQPPDPNRVVFMGDSITDIWKLTDSFPGKPTSIGASADRLRLKCWCGCIPT
jgi:hypothetical protein